MNCCLLCTEEHRRGNLLSAEIHSSNGFTVRDAIQQYFVSQKHLLIGDLTTSSICMICFKTLRNFYEFTSQIDEKYKSAIEADLKPPKEDPEFLEHFEIIESNEDFIKVEAFDDDYSAEYIEEEHIEENILEDDKPETKIVKRNSKNTKKKKLGRPRKHPQKEPRVIVNPEKYNDNFTVPYKHRRAHPKNDAEGEMKIKNLVDIKCHECDIPFETFVDVTKHFRIAHPDTPGYLICCDKKFTKRSSLLEHVEFHDKSVAYKCVVCGRNFKGKSILRNHVRKFHVELQDKAICTVCGKEFSNKYTLKTHMKNHLVDETRQFECYICKKSVKNHLKLLDHFKYRHDPAHNRTSICHVCSKVVTRLEIHMATVHAEEPVERVRCDICGHNLKITSLRGHMRKHSEKQGFNCPICNQSLKNKNTLNCHVKRVHGEGKYKCEYCQKGYHQKGHLTDHIACQHTGTFLYKCRVEECPKEFRNVGRRGLHEKRMHPIEYETLFKPLYLRDNVEIVEYEYLYESDENAADVNEIVVEFQIDKCEKVQEV